MVTNYAFGNSKIVPNLKVNLSPSTTNVLNNIKPTNTINTGAPETRQQPDVLDTVKTGNEKISDFGQNVTNLRIIGANRQRQAQEQTKQRVSGGPGPGGQIVDFSKYSGPVSGARSSLVNQAKSLLGTGYAWGGGGYGIRSSRGTGKGTQNVIGVDCSGLTSYVYGTLGIKLPRQSDAQLRTSGYKTNVKNLQPGDLVGWAKGGHVAMYVGNGQIIESPKPGGRVRTRNITSRDLSTGVYGVHISLPGE